MKTAQNTPPKNVSTAKRIFQIILLLSTAVSLFFVPWKPVFAWLTPLPDSIQAELDASLEDGFEGALLYVDRAGEAPAFYAAGWHDRLAKIPANPHAYFKMASVGKLYDALLLVKLVHAGKLDLEQSVAHYLPEVSGRLARAHQITLRMLVQHRSGLPNITETPDFWNRTHPSKEETLALVYDLQPKFEPGTSYQYCNTNYLLLSMIAERALDAPYAAIMREFVLNPLKLDQTFQSMDELPDLSKLMSGYYVGVEEDIKSTHYGSMVATLEDVGKFVRLLNNGQAFLQGEAELYAQLYEYEHTGLIPGYQTIARYYPEMDAVVVHGVNTTDFSGYHWNLFAISHNRLIRILKNA